MSLRDFEAVRREFLINSVEFFHKFTENGEFFIEWFHSVRHKNRDAWTRVTREGQFISWKTNVLTKYILITKCAKSLTLFMESYKIR